MLYSYVTHMNYGESMPPGKAKFTEIPLPSIIHYCEKDQTTVTQVFLRRHNYELLTEDQISYLKLFFHQGCDIGFIKNT